MYTIFHWNNFFLIKHRRIITIKVLYGKVFDFINLVKFKNTP